MICVLTSKGGRYYAAYLYWRSLVSFLLIHNATLATTLGTLVRFLNYFMYIFYLYLLFWKVRQKRTIKKSTERSYRNLPKEIINRFFIWNIMFFGLLNGNISSIAFGNSDKLFLLCIWLIRKCAAANCCY